MKSETLVNTVRTYDPFTDTWNELGDMPYKRDNPAVCVYGNEIYLFGDNPKLKYTPSTDSWTELNAGLCEIVAYAVPIIDGDIIYLFGGYKSGGGYPNPSNEIWAYIPVQDTIVKLDCEMPFDRFTKGHKYNNYAYLFGGHYYNTLGSVTYEVWRVHLDSICTQTSINEYVFRKDFILHQNYPNPFSGSTIINYELFEPAFISIDIIDVLGKKTAVIINEFQGIGKHEIEWNMNGLSPGIYSMALSNGKTRQHIKMNFSK